MSVVTIPLAAAPNEMVQEEILKLVAHVSRDVAAPRFLENGAVLGFDYLGEEGNREATAPRSRRSRPRSSGRCVDSSGRSCTGPRPDGITGPAR